MEQWTKGVKTVKESVKGSRHNWVEGNLAATLSLSLEAARALDTLPRRSCRTINVKNKSFSRLLSPRTSLI